MPLGRIAADEIVNRPRLAIYPHNWGICPSALIAHAHNANGKRCTELMDRVVHDWEQRLEAARVGSISVEILSAPWPEYSAAAARDVAPEWRRFASAGSPAPWRRVPPRTRRARKTLHYATIWRAAPAISMWMSVVYKVKKVCTSYKKIGVLRRDTYKKTGLTQWELPPR